MYSERQKNREVWPPQLKWLMVLLVTIAIRAVVVFRFGEGASALEFLCVVAILMLTAVGIAIRSRLICYTVAGLHGMTATALLIIALWYVIALRSLYGFWILILPASAHLGVTLLLSSRRTRQFLRP